MPSRHRDSSDNGRKLDEVLHLLKHIDHGMHRIFDALNLHQENLMNTLDDVITELERDTTVSEGIARLVDQLRDEVAAARGDQAKIDSIFAKVKANTDLVAAKLVVNTPNDTPPADTPPV